MAQCFTYDAVRSSHALQKCADLYSEFFCVILKDKAARRAALNAFSSGDGSPVTIRYRIAAFVAGRPESRRH